MKRFLVLGMAVFVALAASGQSADAAKKQALKGTWLVKFYAGPNRVPQPSICVRFFQTNNIAGYKRYSGTWASTTTKGLSGQWVQNGDDVQWYGALKNVSYFSVGDMISAGSISGTAYAQFQNNNGLTITAGTWTATKTNRCSSVGK